MTLDGAWRRIMSVTEFAPSRRMAIATLLIAPLWLLSGTAYGLMLASLASGALILAVVADLAALPRHGRLDVRREFADTVGVGDVAEGKYVVTSSWGASLRVSIFDALPAKFLSDTVPFREQSIPPRGTLNLPLRAVGAARGDVALGDLAARVRTRVGLATRTMRFRTTDRILVAPSIAGVKRFRWLAVHHRLASAGIRTARRRGEGRSFSRLRDYVVGDDPRHIDWKATARRGHPITREFTVEQSQTIFVLVDAGRSMTQLAGRYPRFEYALSTTLLLADVALAAGDRVGAMVFDDELRVLVPAQRGRAALPALRTALIPVQPTLVEPDYAAAFRTLGQRQRKRALIVLVTDVMDARAARSLLAHLVRGARRHLALVVALRNEPLLAAAASGGNTARELYASAAAEELISERLTALQRMRDAGVVVLDVAPDAMAAAVVNEYLELKSRGAL